MKLIIIILFFCLCIVSSCTKESDTNPNTSPVQDALKTKNHSKPLNEKKVVKTKISTAFSVDLKKLLI